MKKIIVLSLLFLAFFSCDENRNQIIKVSSTGKANNLLVVLDNEEWKGEVGDTLRAVLAKSLIGYPQDEPTFNLTHIIPLHFSKLLKPTRNIISVAYGKQNSFQVLTDKYAEPQKIISIVAKDKNSLMQLIKKHDAEMISAYRESDLKLVAKQLLKKTWDPKNIETFNNLKAHIKIPYAYRKVRDTANYIYFRKVIPGGFLNLQMYAVPIKNDDDLNGENIILTRNDFGKRFIPGSKENMYVTTEDAYAPAQFDTKIAGLKAYETRGLWEMENGFMGGPFLNYTAVDTKNNRLVVVEGFAYAPNRQKRDYMFELEILLKTLVIE